MEQVVVRPEKPSSRLLWLDWMKVMAIFSIIWGHFFSAGYVYLYVFSVQVFCLISGFLFKKTPDWKTCVQKCFWQLFVPTVIMSVLMHLEAYFRCMAQGTDYYISWPWFFKWLLLGHRWCMGPCWYFYSLIVMRLIMQALPQKKWAYAVLFAVLSSCAIYLHYIGFEVSNANVNVLVCMPLFLIGVFLQTLKPALSSFRNYLVEIVILAGSIAIIYLCGKYNGCVWMYLNGYGDNFALFILGGLAGTFMLYVVSLWLSRLPGQTIPFTLSKGSILIIGLHIIIVRRLMQLPDRFWGEDFIASVLILLLFVPIIRLAERFFPLLLGRMPGRLR